MKAYYLLIMIIACCGKLAYAQKKTFPLTDTKGLQSVSVMVTTDNYKNKKSVRLTDTATNRSGPTQSFAKIIDLNFHNGIIELELEGKPLPTAGEQARGFVGIAFRIADDDSKYECIYLRPTNGRADDQVRRNHSVQYSSQPDFQF